MINCFENCCSSAFKVIDHLQYRDNVHFLLSLLGAQWLSGRVLLKLAMHLLKVWSKRHPVERRKMRGASRKCTFSRYCKWSIPLKLIFCLLCIFYYRTTPNLKTLGQFENLVFVIMSTRENIRLITRTPLNRRLFFFCFFLHRLRSWNNQLATFL